MAEYAIRAVVRYPTSQIKLLSLSIIGQERLAKRGLVRLPLGAQRFNTETIE
jgi:hypothetical protein